MNYKSAEVLDTEGRVVAETKYTDQITYPALGSPENTTLDGNVIEEDEHVALPKLPSKAEMLRRRFYSNFLPGAVLYGVTASHIIRPEFMSNQPSAIEFSLATVAIITSYTLMGSYLVPAGNYLRKNITLRF